MEFFYHVVMWQSIFFLTRLKYGYIDNHKSILKHRAMKNKILTIKNPLKIPAAATLWAVPMAVRDLPGVFLMYGGGNDGTYKGD